MMGGRKAARHNRQSRLSTQIKKLPCVNVTTLQVSFQTQTFTRHGNSLHTVFLPTEKGEQGKDEKTKRRETDGQRGGTGGMA